jgi:hypothetical protein
LIASAGLAEAAWLFDSILLTGGLLIIATVGGIGLRMRSRVVASAAAALLALFTFYFEPWYLFEPFETAAYSDPDVAYAAWRFRALGIGWVITTLLVLVSVVTAWRRPLDAEEPGRR